MKLLLFENSLVQEGVIMPYTALYRKWRPLTFDDVIGQKHITITIKNQVISGKTAHAYLFCGTRGTGKTSTAKILSRAVNCLNNDNGNPCNECEICKGIIDGSIMDVIEIDAASNNGVDNIREITDDVIYTPSKGKYKVYIIDEVHMLSTGAFNALLKTLEEPPSHILFILATTEPHKIPATILSRCQRFDFKRISSDDIVTTLKMVVEKEKINIDEKALKLIASVCDGALRDAFSILDQCIAFSREFISYDDVMSILGMVDDSILFNMAECVAKKDIDEAICIVDKVIIDGRDIVHFMNELIEHFRNVLMCKILNNPEDILDMTKENILKLKKQSEHFTQEKITACIKILSDAYYQAKKSTNTRIILEIAVIKLCKHELDTSPEAILSRISELEDSFTSGSFENVKKAKKDIKKVKSEENKNEKIKSEIKDINNSEIVNKEVSTESNKEIAKYLNNAVNKWAEVLAKVKKAKRMALYGYLANAEVKPMGDKLGIIFKTSINKMMVSRNDNMKFLHETVARLIKNELDIKCYLESELSSAKVKKEDKLNNIIALKNEFGNKMEIYDDK